MIVYYLNVPGNNRRIWWSDKRIVPLEVVRRSKNTLIAKARFKNGMDIRMSFNTDQANKAYFNSHIEALCAMEELVTKSHSSTKKNSYSPDSIWK